MSKSKEYGAQLYDAAVLTVGAVGISFASRKLTRDTLGVPMTLKFTLVVDLRSVDDNDAMGAGYNVSDTKAGVQLTIF